MQERVYRVPIGDTHELQQRLVEMWAEFQHGKKDWKRVSMTMVDTLNTCCDVACLTLKLSHNTTGSFHSHQCHTTPLAFFRATNVWNKH